MQAPSFDPGLTQKYSKGLKRIINADGRFNVRRTGATWRDFQPYLFLVDAPLPVFISIVLAGYLGGNLLFACIYWIIGVEHLHGAAAATPLLTFMNAFFLQHPYAHNGWLRQYLSGRSCCQRRCLLGSACGSHEFRSWHRHPLGRFSRPTARIGYSKRMVVAPYEEITSLQFRIVNRRAHNLLNLEARVLLMTVQLGDGLPRRKFDILSLERDSSYFSRCPGPSSIPSPTPVLFTVSPPTTLTPAA